MIRMICFGKLDWKLGAEHLLIALRALLDRGVTAELEFVGDGPERERILFTIDDLALDASARILPARQDAAERLRAADILIVGAGDPGLHDDLAQIAAAGVVVIWTGRPGSAAPIEHDVTGLAIPFRDPQALLEALILLARDEAMRDRLIRNAADPMRAGASP